MLDHMKLLSRCMVVGDAQKFLTMFVALRTEVGWKGGDVFVTPPVPIDENCYLSESVIHTKLFLLMANRIIILKVELDSADGRGKRDRVNAARQVTAEIFQLLLLFLCSVCTWFSLSMITSSCSLTLSFVPPTSLTRWLAPSSKTLAPPV